MLSATVLQTDTAFCNFI